MQSDTEATRNPDYFTYEPQSESDEPAPIKEASTANLREGFSLTSAELASLEVCFNHRRELSRHREQELFGVLAGDLSDEERLALEWLYAHMPINDLADYTGELFLAHVRQALNMRSEMPWGAEVPDHLFLHYVLPPRINNERLEDYRSVIAGELLERVQHLSMTEAVLEANYWCYEKATYTGSDARTLSPLGLIRSAKGRCGEESTLTTAALRSIGIPARQCYTPRWAHVDDNHAWVEAWVDGAWHYLGACEPEPALDRGWFDGPARRAMLVHTRVSAGYPGPEPITVTGGSHTEINLLANYAPTRTLTVQVVDRSEVPAAGADVQFQLYNYAELHPIAQLQTDEQGRTSFVTGYGDLVVRAAQGGWWGETIVRGFGAESVKESILLTLDHQGQPEGNLDFELTPPREIAAAEDSVDEAMLTRHGQRMTEGEQIRAAYERTFADEEQAAALADRLRLDASRVLAVLQGARGNAAEIAAFLEEHASRYGEWPLRLLESLTAKDWIDSDRRTLDDHLLHGLEALADYAPGLDLASPADWAGDSGANGSAAPLPEDLAHVLNPRVRWERLAPYRGALRAAFTAEERAAFRADPRKLARMVTANWTVRSDLTPIPGKASPAGTWALKTGDRESVEILLIALCRSLGIPARLHPASQRPQAQVGGQWLDLERPTSPHTDNSLAADGTLRLLRSAVSGSPAASMSAGTAASEAITEVTAEATADASVTASYRENFTLARLEGGFYTTLEYPFREKDVYDRPFELQEGDYRMTTGIRLQDGHVKGRIFHFRIQPGCETLLEANFRQLDEPIPVLGTAVGTSRLLLPGGEPTTLAEQVGSGGALVAWIDQRLEPTRHLLREAGELRAELENAGVPFIWILQDGGRREEDLNLVSEPSSPPIDRSHESGMPAEVQPFAPKPLPSASVFVYDLFNESLASMQSICPLPGSEYPHLFVLDGELNIRYVESGYKPGSCKEALQVLRAIEH
ncbi:hypothetical protein B9G55_07145 [Saccharibacillus sp. O16]|nr:hypothetical protein B9G55_07145 [Saccharibacillus sp. O16]